MQNNLPTDATQKSIKAMAAVLFVRQQAEDDAQQHQTTRASARLADGRPELSDKHADGLGDHKRTAWQRAREPVRKSRPIVTVAHKDMYRVTSLLHHHAVAVEL
jgi:hypothetical protein